jgi:hypothetical protein
VYFVTSAPPFDNGALQEIEIAPGDATAETEVGAVGSPDGVVGSVVADAGPVPFALMAATETTYAVPFCRPPMTQVVVEPPTEHEPAIADSGS